MTPEVAIVLTGISGALTVLQILALAIALEQRRATAAFWLIAGIALGLCGVVGFAAESGVLS